MNEGVQSGRAPLSDNVPTPFQTLSEEEKQVAQKYEREKNSRYIYFILREKKVQAINKVYMLHVKRFLSGCVEAGHLITCGKAFPTH